MKIVNIKFKKLDENAVIPSYAHYGDVGMDGVVGVAECIESHFSN